VKSFGFSRSAFETEECKSDIHDRVRAAAFIRLVKIHRSMRPLEDLGFSGRNQHTFRVSAVLVFQFGGRVK